MQAPQPTARRILIAAQLGLAALVLYFIGRTLVAQWAAFRAQPLEAEPRWPDIAASGLLVLVAHAVLVQTWRRMLAVWGDALPFFRAARIWSISNLGRYVPGKIWQIGAMAELARREGVSAVAATGSALISTIVNIAVGIALVLALGWRWLDLVDDRARLVSIVLIVAAAAGLLFLPVMMPRIAAFVSRATGRQIELRSPPPRVAFVALVGNLLAWLLYGLAFMLLVRGVLGADEASGPMADYIAVYAAAYVVGYLFLILPGGIGPREAVMVLLLTSLALATPKQAWLVAGASRVWLTVLELVPGLLFLAGDASRRRSSTNS